MILLGSTFPLSLIRRRANIEPGDLDELRRRLASEGFVSFWGHDNTRNAAEVVLGVDPAPRERRPSITLDSNLFPCLGGRSFQEVWVLSPDFEFGFRPATGIEVPAEQIEGWKALRLLFPSN